MGKTDQSLSSTIGLCFFFLIEEELWAVRVRRDLTIDSSPIILVIGKQAKRGKVICPRYT